MMRAPRPLAADSAVPGKLWRAPLWSLPHAPSKKFGRNGLLRQDGRAHSCGNPWKSVDGGAKSLIHLAKCSTGLQFFYTGCLHFYTSLAFFYTSRFSPTFAEVLVISFFLKEKKIYIDGRSANRHPRNRTIAYFLVHGLEACFRPTRGYPCNQLSLSINGLSAQLGLIHGSRVQNACGGVKNG